MKKNFVILSIICAFIACKAGANCLESDVLKQTRHADIPNCNEFVNKMFNERATVYNVLNLTPQQKACKNEIEKRRYVAVDTKTEILAQEMYVLQKLECDPQANKTAIAKQKKVVKCARKDLEDTMKTYDKEFKSILSGEQKAKYRAIQRFQKRDLRRCEQHKSLYKKDKNIQVFGQPYSYNEDSCPKHGIRHFRAHKCKLEK